MLHKKPLLQLNSDMFGGNITAAERAFGGGVDVMSLDEAMQQAVVTQTGDQHIGFKVENEELLLDVRVVREIIMLPYITFVPRAHFSIEGVIALRGEIMPVVNMRKLLGLEQGEPTASTRVIILSDDRGGFGIIVDTITEFVWLQEKQVEAVDPNFFSHHYKLLSGVAKLGDKVRGIVEVRRLTQEFAAPIKSTTDEEGHLEDEKQAS